MLHILEPMNLDACTHGLSYVLQPKAVDFDVPQVGAVRLWSLPRDGDLQVNVSFVSSHLPSAVALLAVNRHLGSPLLATFERTPDSAHLSRWHAERGLEAFAESAHTLAERLPGTVLLKSHLFDSLEVATYLSEHSHGGLAIGSQSMTDMLRTLWAFAVGYSPVLLAVNYPGICAFPNETHACQFDLFGDVCWQINEGTISPAHTWMDWATPRKARPTDRDIQFARDYFGSFDEQLWRDRPPIRDLIRSASDQMGRRVSEHEVDYLYDMGLL